jgi:hypothetical protein
LVVVTLNLLLLFFFAAAWIFVRNGTSATWSQQGSKLVGNDYTQDYDVYQGQSVAISSDGNLVVVSGDYDNNLNGAIWIFLRTAGAWSQVGNKIIDNDETGEKQFGYSLALSSDDQTLVVGGYLDRSMNFFVTRLLV